MRAKSDLALLRWRAQDEAVEFGLDGDLAAEAGVGLHVEGEVQHVFFHLRARAGLLDPGGVDINVAGRASAGAAAFRGDFGNVVGAVSMTVEPVSPSTVRAWPCESTKVILAFVGAPPPGSAP